MVGSSGQPPRDPARPNPMAQGQWLTLSFRSDQLAVREALQRVHDAFLAAKLPDEVIQPAQIVLGEVFNNVVEHAYGERQDGQITLRLQVRDGQVFCDVRDAGGPMPHGPLPGGTFPDIDPNDPLQWPEGGFGWALVRELTEELSYERGAAENILRFRIRPETA